jgi:ABC-type uncharacterized transport system substrate-binding protein
VIRLLRFALCLFAASALSPHAWAQGEAGIPRVGILQTSAPTSNLVRAFIEGMREQGFVEGRNIRYEFRVHEGVREKMEAHARELAKSRVALIFVMNTASALAAQKSTGSVPIVFTTVGNPVGVGLVRSLAAPGGNITGFSLMNEAMRAKRVEILHEIAPAAGRIGVLHDARQSTLDAPTLADLHTAAGTFGKELRVVDVGEPARYDEALLQLDRWGAQALLLLESTRIYNHRNALLERVAALRLPLVAATGEYAEAGALISYGADYLDLSRRAAEYAARIVKGEKPANLPVQQPTKFEMIVNLRTAKTMGFSVPRQVLLRADRVIE